MQIQPTTAASVAAGTVSQATSRDRTPGGSAEAAQVSAALGVERIARSEAADADRDAQGGGQGLDSCGEDHVATEVTIAQSASGLSVSSPEPPSQLDIVG